MLLIISLLGLAKPLSVPCDGDRLVSHAVLLASSVGAIQSALGLGTGTSILGGFGAIAKGIGGFTEMPMSLHCLLLFDHPTRTGEKKISRRDWETFGFTASGGDQYFQQQCGWVKSRLISPHHFQGGWAQTFSSSPSYSTWPFGQDKHLPSGLEVLILDNTVAQLLSKIWTKIFGSFPTP